MSIFDRGIRGNIQNPFNGAGDASTVAYSNPRMPSGFNGNVALGMDYILDALYPNYKGTVPTKADLPTTATANDYYIVNDDGDGKSAGYVYSSIEGVTQWIKRYDVDYSAEGILAEAVNRTSYMYVSKFGASDRDPSGNIITGTFAGQTMYGGEVSGQNFTIFANKQDLTGLLQVNNSVIPLQPNLTIGSNTNGFNTGYFSTLLKVGTLSITPATLTDSSGTVNVIGQLAATQKVSSATALQVGTLVLTPGSILDSGGVINFGSNKLTTTGEIDGGSAVIAGFTLTTGSIAAAGGTINFNSANFTSVGNITANKLVTTEVDVNDLILTSDLIATASSSTLTIQAKTGGGTTTVQIPSALNLTSTLTVSGLSTLNTTSATLLTVGASAKVSTVSGNAQFEAQSADLILATPGFLRTNATFLPTTDNTRDLGSTTFRFKSLYLSAGLSDGTNTTTTSSLLSLRNINSGVSQGMSLFYDSATNTWLPSIPDTEIVHNTLSGLTAGDAGHTQFALLAGRSGGQTLFGGTASGENLTLDSTSNATKGLVLVSSVLSPTTDSATDFGTTAKQWRHMYSVGLHYGLRFDQYAGSGLYPTNSAAKIGRVIWDTSANQLLVDNGTSWSKVGNQKWMSDVSMDGTTTVYNVNVSSTIADARTGVWQLADNQNGFERVQAKLTFSQTQVTITSSPALAAGSYRLVGFN